MTPEAVAIVLRLAALVAVFQAAGGSLYLQTFAGRLEHSTATVRRWVQAAAVAACALLVAQQCQESARLAGEFSGIFDFDLERTVWGSRGGAVHVVQVIGLALIACSLAVPRRVGLVLAAAAAVATLAAFVGQGHTSVNSQRWILGPLMLVHLLVGAFWFGSLVPLIVMVRRNSILSAGHTLASFSTIAGLLVPCFALAGLGVLALLARGFFVFSRPYGELLAVKMAAFALLLPLAAYNRWRGAPALASGREGSARRLVNSIVCEILLMTAALAATATLTTCCSPQD